MRLSIIHKGIQLTNIYIIDQTNDGFISSFYGCSLLMPSKPIIHVIYVDKILRPLSYYFWNIKCIKPGQVHSFYNNTKLLIPRKYVINGTISRFCDMQHLYQTIITTGLYRLRSLYHTEPDKQNQLLDKWLGFTL